MVESHIDDVIDRRDFVRRKDRREVLGQEAGLVVRHGSGYGVLHVHRIDYRGTEFLHVGQSFIGDTNAIPIRQGGFDHEVPQHAQPFASEVFGIGRVAELGLDAAGGRGDGVLGVIPYEGFHHQGRVGNRAAQRTGAVSRV